MPTFTSEKMKNFRLLLQTALCIRRNVSALQESESAELVEERGCPE